MVFCEAALDKEMGGKGQAALQNMLMGLEPAPDGKFFLAKECAKYQKQKPTATEALATLEYMFVLQQAGKSAQVSSAFFTHCPFKEMIDPVQSTYCTRLISLVPSRRTSTTTTSSASGRRGTCSGRTTSSRRRKPE